MCMSVCVFITYGKIDIGGEIASHPLPSPCGAARGEKLYTLLSGAMTLMTDEVAVE